MLVAAARAVLLAAFVALWEVAARFGWINAFVVSQPSKALATTAAMARRGDLWLHLGMTVGETAIGFTVGTLILSLIHI